MTSSKPESELLRQRLDDVRREKSDLMARLKDLQAREEKLSFALSVLEDVLLEFQVRPARQAETASDIDFSRAALLPSPSERQTLEQLILSLFHDGSPFTSAEVVGSLDLVTDAKKESILSTLSRMVSKGLLRREGRLYFLSSKGEGSEVATTPEPSVATTSVRGQATSGLLTGEEGDDEL